MRGRCRAFNATSFVVILLDLHSRPWSLCRSSDHEPWFRCPGSDAWHPGFRGERDKPLALVYHPRRSSRACLHFVAHHQYAVRRSVGIEPWPSRGEVPYTS
jgi:hypothetical protein